MNEKLAKLEKVDVREVWKNEAKDFTSWLAEPQNLASLGEEIDIELTLLKTEAPVGAFAADILAEEERTGRKVVIENQLEQTNHDHLGKILTYASGYDANILIWIAKDIREEHRQAVDWLNERAGESLLIFLIRLEVWQIGNSSRAPKFQIICSPNTWAKSIKTGGELTDTKTDQLRYWEEFRTYLVEHSQDYKFSPRQPRPQHWYTLSIGTSKMYIALVVSEYGGFIRTELYIKNNKELYFKFFGAKDIIEKELGFPVEWEELPDAKASRIKLERSDVDLANENNFSSYFKWYLDTATKFANVFMKHL